MICSGCPLAAEYEVNLKKNAALSAWHASNQPFHRFVESYGIVGGDPLPGKVVYGTAMGSRASEVMTMQRALHIRTTVLPGGKVEFASSELEAGQSVDVVVTRSSSTERRSVVDILAEAPGHLLFKTSKEVDDYLREEKASWDR